MQINDKTNNIITILIVHFHIQNMSDSIEKTRLIFMCHENNYHNKWKYYKNYE